MSGVNEILELHAAAIAIQSPGTTCVGAGTYEPLSEDTDLGKSATSLENKLALLEEEESGPQTSPQGVATLKADRK